MTWVIREVKIKAKGKNRKRPNIVQRKNEKLKEKRRVDRYATSRFRSQRSCLIKTSTVVRSVAPQIGQPRGQRCGECQYEIKSVGKIGRTFAPEDDGAIDTACDKIRSSNRQINRNGEASVCPGAQRFWKAWQAGAPTNDTLSKAGFEIEFEAKRRKGKSKPSHCS